MHWLRGQTNSADIAQAISQAARAQTHFVATEFYVPAESINNLTRGLAHSLGPKVRCNTNGAIIKVDGGAAFAG